MNTSVLLCNFGSDFMTAKNENKWYRLGTASAKIMITDINLKQIRKRKIIKIDLRSTRTFVTTSSSNTITSALEGSDLIKQYLFNAYHI